MKTQCESRATDELGTVDVEQVVGGLAGKHKCYRKTEPAIPS